MQLSASEFPIELSVVVPVFNSATIVAELVSRTLCTLKNMELNGHEVILVDDCSADDAWNAILKLCAENDCVKGLRLGKNVGQWRCTLAGVHSARGRLIVTMDDDLQYSPEDIETLYRAIVKEKKPLVIGVAADKYNNGVLKSAISGPRKRLVDLLWQKFPTDSFKMFSRNVVFDQQGNGSPLHIEAMIKHALDRRHVGYVNVSFNQRFSGKSNHSFIKKLLLLLKFTPEYYLRPTSFIALLTVGVCLLAFCLDMILQTNGDLRLLPWTVAVCAFLVLFVGLNFLAEVRATQLGIPPYWIIEKVGFGPSKNQNDNQS